MRSSLRRTAIVIVSSALMVACTSTPPAVDPGVSRELALRRAESISNLGYTLELTLPATPGAAIVGKVTIELDLADPAGWLQLDFQPGPDSIARLAANGSEADWHYRNEHIAIAPAGLRAGRNRIDIDFVAGSTSLNRNPDFLYTLFVPDRARTAFPLFDQPDLKATFELILHAPADWQALSNAPLLSVERDGERATHHFARSQPISSYLFSFVAGRFDAVTETRNGRTMTMLHRETDSAKVARNVGAIFDLHAAAIEWLEDYTGIAYPWEKLDFALLPAFQYSGMEHTGAIQYRAARLLLDESPTETELLQRASLIAHETAHMWFGDLVTMRWFDDVWTKEVFANFMAAKIVNPSFPAVNHELSFLADHYPSAYAVDRSAGANAIRQRLDNLNEAGQLYGPAIYDKAPIMMRQLEMLVGVDGFRDGMREYLDRFAFDNATWPDLISILDARTPIDLASWSDVWVNTAGRPEFGLSRPASDGSGTLLVEQLDPDGLERVWPQRFTIAAGNAVLVDSVTAATPIEGLAADGDTPLVFNADGRGYGLFPAALGDLRRWPDYGEVEKGAVALNVYEQLLAGEPMDVAGYAGALLDIVAIERNQILLELALGQLSRIWISWLGGAERDPLRPRLEATVWHAMEAQQDDGARRMLFEAFAELAESREAVQRVYDVWSQTSSIDGLTLAERDYVSLAATLAIRLPEQAEDIVAAQLRRIDNPDERRRFEFISPALSASSETRDRFFASLANEANRTTESWVVDAVELLHHPSRTADSERYILPSLELLEELQATGDIFFPTNWLNATLRNHTSASAASTVRAFLAARPAYNEQLRMKILQAADMLLRTSGRVTGEAASDRSRR